jgi:hypothetical protein
MENFTLLVAGIIFWYLFWGPHMKSEKPKDDKKGGGDKGVDKGKK